MKTPMPAALLLRSASTTAERAEREIKSPRVKVQHRTIGHHRRPTSVDNHNLLKDQIDHLPRKTPPGLSSELVEENRPLSTRHEGTQAVEVTVVRNTTGS